MYLPSMNGYLWARAYCDMFILSKRIIGNTKFPTFVNETNIY